MCLASAPSRVAATATATATATAAAAAAAGRRSGTRFCARHIHEQVRLCLEHLRLGHRPHLRVAHVVPLRSLLPVVLLIVLLIVLRLVVSLASSGVRYRQRALHIRKLQGWVGE